MKLPSKAARIRALYAQGKSTREIAEIVLGLDCDAPHKERDRKMAYVRAVARQRGPTGGRRIASEIRYRKSPKGLAARRDRHHERWAAEPEYRERLHKRERSRARKREARLAATESRA